MEFFFLILNIILVLLIGYVCKGVGFLVGIEIEFGSFLVRILENYWVII